MKDQLRITFWDVRYGSATYIKTPYVPLMGRERHVIVDLGTSADPNSNQIFNPALELDKQIEEEYWLDYLIITHPHMDHISGITELPVEPRTMRKAVHILEEDLKDSPHLNDEKLKKYFEMVREYSHPTSPVNVFENPVNWGGVEFKTFHPTNCDKKQLNNHSIVTIVKFGNAKIVIPGDNEKESLQELLDMDGFLEAVKDSFALLAPHHGRESGYYHEFVNIVNPKITVISDGKDLGTSAVDKYSLNSRSFKVFCCKTDEYKTRKCLSTRNDGNISMILSHDSLHTHILTGFP